jgi:hypothetical protein
MMMPTLVTNTAVIHLPTHRYRRHGGSYERDSYEADHSHRYKTKYEYEKDSYEQDSSYKYGSGYSGDDDSSSSYKSSVEDSNEGYSGDEDSSGKKIVKTDVEYPPTTAADTDKSTYTNQIIIRYATQC